MLVKSEAGRQRVRRPHCAVTTWLVAVRGWWPPACVRVRRGWRRRCGMAAVVAGWRAAGLLTRLTACWTADCLLRLGLLAGMAVCQQ
jgi:hypothetical protein